MSQRRNEQLKNFGIRILAALMRGLVRGGNQRRRLPRLLRAPAKQLGRTLLSIAVVPIYKGYLTTKKTLKKFYAPHKRRHRLIHPFVRRYLVHVVICTLGVFTVLANINAEEVRREDQVRTSILSAYIATDDLGSIHEEGPIPTGRQATHYMGMTGIRPRYSLDPNAIEETDYGPTLAGQSAVVRPILSPIESQFQHRDKVLAYVVQNGDTVSGIAQKFGISVNTLLWENNLTAYSLIRPGNTLNILPVTGIRHKVAKNDTLSKISKDYAISVDEIIEANRLASASDITPGEQLIIPGGKKPYTPPAYTARNTFYQAPQASSARVISTGKMIWPNSCSRVSQYYGYRHTGVDIACPSGVNVFAADSGRVIKAVGGWNGGYGNMIIIDHGNGTQTLYGHLSQIGVQVGDTVEKGQTIGREGSTGRSTGPHLHFEVRSGGVRRNPLQYIR